ncbi:MAG: hypothetical protein ABFC73_04980 [Clostridiaceae bacterium]
MTRNDYEIVYDALLDTESALEKQLVKTKTILYSIIDACSTCYSTVFQLAFDIAERITSSILINYTITPNTIQETTEQITFDETIYVDKILPEVCSSHTVSVLTDGFNKSEYEKITSLVIGAVCEDGYYNQAEQYVLELFVSRPMLTCTYLSKLQSDYMNNLDVQEIILHVLSHIEYERVDPLGQTIIASILGTHASNVIIQDRVIRCFEHWSNPEGIKYLSNIICTTKWLDEYRLQTIKFLGETV